MGKSGEPNDLEAMLTDCLDSRSISWTTGKILIFRYVRIGITALRCEKNGFEYGSGLLKREALAGLFELSIWLQRLSDAISARILYSARFESTRYLGIKSLAT